MALLIFCDLSEVLVTDAGVTEALVCVEGCEDVEDMVDRCRMA